MSVVAIIVGILLVTAVIADIANTLVATNTSQSRWWLTSIIYRRLWQGVRSVAVRISNEKRRANLLAAFPPLGVLVMLTAWATQQVIGFGLIWWGIGGIQGVDGIGDSLYYSGVVYFTVGFGEVVPADAIPRAGALVEAFAGVITTALVIGYLPALYGAYSDREGMLMRLDDGTEGRISPTSLVISRAPTADTDDLLAYFRDWETWVAHTLETHTTFPMLTLFRSQQRGQNWITALGLLADTALHLELIEETRGRDGYWTLRRSVRLFDQLTQHVDLSEYRARLDASYEDEQQFRDLHETLRAHGFNVVPYDEALAHTRELRRLYDAQLEYLIDFLLTPRGFWGHEVGHVAHVHRRGDVAAGPTPATE